MFNGLYLSQNFWMIWGQNRFLVNNQNVDTIGRFVGVIDVFNDSLESDWFQTRDSDHNRQQWVFFQDIQNVV